MATRCLSTCFGLYVLLSLMTHLAELVLSTMLAYTLYTDVIYRDVFFALTAGVLIIPLVTIQLVSAIFLLRRRGDSMTSGEAVCMALLHVLQLGFIWRHVSVLKERDALAKKNDLSELFVLRLTFTFAAGFPLVLIQLYLVLTEAELSWSWIVYASLVASVLSTTWAVASFRRSHETVGRDTDSVVLSWPGSLFRLLWRVGEIVARVISLTLFATLYREWVFLVLGFHWVIMLLCLSIPQAKSADWCGSTLTHRVAFCVVTSYSYIFCYINVSRVRTAVWYTLYYVIMFLENGTLSIVWLTKSESESFTSRYLLVFISTLAFFAAMVCLAVYYKYFHVTTDSCPDLAKASGVCVAKDTSGGCICSTHHHRHNHHPPHPSNNPAQLPYTSGWMSQYHSALTSGQYYKHAMHDSLLDSASEHASMTTAGSVNHRLQHKLTAMERDSAARVAVLGHHHNGAVLGHHHSGGRRGGGGERCGGCTCRDDAGSVVSCQTSRSVTSCPHRRFLKTSRSDLTDTTSVLTLASGASHNLGYEGSDESQCNAVPAWLPAGESLIAKHLMAPDSVPGESAPGGNRRQDKAMEHYRYLLKQEAQRWASTTPDGYSTDHTVLEWSKLPVTHLGPNVWGINEPDSDQCHACCRCSELSPGDSEVSSIFKAVHRDGCEGCCCGGGGGEGGGDAVYGVPAGGVVGRHHHLHPLKGHRKNTSSSDSEGAGCPCCHEHQEGGRYYHSQPDVYTISHKDLPGDCEGQGQGQEKYRVKQSVSDSEGLSRRQGGVFKKSSKHVDRKRKDRDHSADGRSPRDHSDGGRYTRDHSGEGRSVRDHSDEGGRSSRDHVGNGRSSRDHSGGRSKNRQDSTPERAGVHKKKDADSSSVSKSDPDSHRSEVKDSHVPSKLQVKAIAEKSDDDSPVRQKPITSSSSTSSSSIPTSEPIYANISAHIHRQQKQHQKPQTTSNSTDGFSDKLKDIESADLRDQNEDDAQNKLNKNNDLRTKRLQLKNEDVQNKANKDKRCPRGQPEEGEHPLTNLKSSRPDRHGRHPTGGKDPWYVCSESEDSALPPETFSSSVDDGFTATDLDDSDGSIELII
ncbi:uncharacterized protein [Littorina saxatilis]|uniref:XK-related protein n=1 Tax=Littorina saxatilis TaxID=31220 RepID=A0AAN9GAY1_9CAEN